MSIDSDREIDHQDYILTDYSKPLVTKITMMMAMIKTMPSSLYISGQFLVVCFLQSVCALFCYVPQDLGPLAVLEICPLELGITQFPSVFRKVVGLYDSLICSKERLLGGGVRVTLICEYKAMYLTCMDIHTCLCNYIFAMIL